MAQQEKASRILPIVKLNRGVKEAVKIQRIQMGTAWMKLGTLRAELATQEDAVEKNQ